MTWTTASRGARLGAAAAITAALLLAGCSARIVRVPDGSEVAPKALASQLAGRRVVVVGEAHDEEAHHRFQLEVIKGLKAAGAKVAVGLEFITADDQPALDKFLAGASTEEEFVEVYARNWKVPWGQYRAIFIYARENGVPMRGLNVSRDVLRKVFRSGGASLTPEESRGAGEAVAGGVISCDVDADYQRLIMSAMKEHANKDAYKSYCEAQVLWDSYMARRAADYIESHPGSTFVILAGAAHSWKRGIPARLKRLTGVEASVILPESEDRFSLGETTAGDADYLWIGR